MYGFTLEATDLMDKGFELLVQGDTLPKDDLCQLVVYPAAAVESVRAAHVVLAKTLQIAAGFGLTERELTHLFFIPLTSTTSICPSCRRRG